MSWAHKTTIVAATPWSGVAPCWAIVRQPGPWDCCSFSWTAAWKAPVSSPATAVCVSRRWTDRERSALREPSDVDHERPQAGLPRQERRGRRHFGEEREREERERRTEATGFCLETFHPLALINTHPAWRHLDALAVPEHLTPPSSSSCLCTCVCVCVCVFVKRERE